MKIKNSALCLVVLMVCVALPSAVSAAVAADSASENSSSAVIAASSEGQSLDSASGEILTAQGSQSGETASDGTSEEGVSWVPTLIQICVILIGCELVILAVITFMKMKRKIK